MNHLETVEKIFTTLQTTIKHHSFRETYFENKNSFIRHRDMPLQELIAFLMQRSGKSMDIKLDEWFATWKSAESIPVSRQAISKARQLIPANVFHDFLRTSSEIFLKHSQNKKTWNGYQIYAIDGTDLQIPTTEETLKDFGGVSTRYETRMAGATASALFDVTNDLILDSVMCPYKTCERKMAQTLLDATMTAEMKENSIVIFDRGYPSYDFLGYLFDNKINFVIRVKEQMSKLRDMQSLDGEVYRKCGSKCRTIRTIQLHLETGTKEYLITNLSKNQMDYEKFAELYFMRWGIEGKYRELKSRMELENFSGKKTICVKQDYFISLFISNICSLIKQEVDHRMQNKKKIQKEYQSRRSFLIYQLNRYISGIFLNRVNIREILEAIVKKCKKKRSQIRRNRKCERNLNLNRRKYSMTYKKCI